MSYRIEKTVNNTQDLIIDGFEKGIATSPYLGVSNMRNVNASYYPGVAYVNYKRQLSTLTNNAIGWYAGTHSTNVSNNIGWNFSASGSTPVMTNPLHKATSPAGLNYIIDDSGQIFKQSAVNSSSFNLLGGRLGSGHTGLAYWNNYLVVFGGGMIEFCGLGTSDTDITSSNWDKSTSSATTTVTMSLASLDYVDEPQLVHFTVNPLTGNTSATLNSAWLGTSGTYLVQFTNPAVDQRQVTFTNGATTATWSGGLTNDCTSTVITMYQMFTPNILTGQVNFTVGSLVTFSSTGALPAGLVAGTQYYITAIGALSGPLAVRVSSTYGGPFIPFSDGGSGIFTMTMVPSVAPPLQNTTITGFTWSSANIGSSTITLATPWTGASGIYNIVDPTGNNFTALFSYNSTTVSLTNPATSQAPTAGTFSVQIINPSSTTNKTWVSKVDGNLYFANGRWVGRIQSSPNFNITFNPAIPASYSVNYSATATLQPQDSVVDMTDLRGQMIILGNFDIYPWDYNASQPSASSPIGEQTSSLINILNNVYVFAGQKGNIYVSNGSTAQLFYKMPDFISGVFDPVWSWGGTMFHRGKLFFQALVQNTSGTNILSGIFSLIVSPGLLIESASGLVMEAQNSFGLTPSAGAVATGVLIDNEPSSNGQDSYYSAYSRATNTGGIDYNTTTPWGSSEAVIETDLIPMGDFLNRGTYGNIEFKLDRPMVSGDSISLYWRPTLSDSYTLIGTTTTAVMSDYKQSDISLVQWIQFKVTMSCASSNSSLVPLREIRLHFN